MVRPRRLAKNGRALHGMRALSGFAVVFAAGLLLGTVPGGTTTPAGQERVESSAPTPVQNFTSAINRLVELVALAGSGVLALVWARVALSWFSNDITKKVQAKDRARDALIGSLLFVAAITGLVWGLAHWVLTGV